MAAKVAQPSWLRLIFEPHPDTLSMDNQWAIDLDGVVTALKATGFQGTLTNDLYSNPLSEEAARRNVAKIRAVEKELGIL